jgi:ATP-binding cassette subfamily G (WHITE) protein 2 (PDR)
MISVFEQLRICVQRNVQRLQNNWSAPLAAVIGNVIMGIIVSSIFYNLDTTTASFYNRSVLIFFATLLNGFMSSFEVSADEFCSLTACGAIVLLENRY